MNNNRQPILKEEDVKTVNTVQLEDLSKAASSVEIKIIQLADMAISFSNGEIKKAVTVLRSHAHALNTLISDAMSGADQALVATTQPLEAPAPAEDMIESRTPSINITESRMSKIAKLMLYTNASLKEAKEFIDEMDESMLEKFDPSIFNKKDKDEDKEDNGDGDDEDFTTDNKQDIEETIDLNEAYHMPNKTGVGFPAFVKAVRSKLEEKFKLDPEEWNNCNRNNFDSLMENIYSEADKKNIKILFNV